MRPCALPFLNETNSTEPLMGDDDRDPQQEAWANEIQQWRYQENVEALKRCLKAGARQEDIKTLARECGVAVKDITFERPNEPQQSN
jgi:hypothetical protein